MVARNRVVLNGSIGNATERWSVSLHFGGGGNVVSGGAALQDWADIIAANLDADALEGTLSNGISSSGTLDRVDIYEYEATGPAVATASAPMTLVGSGNGVNPLQTCIVFTLKGAQAGARRRGRSYWPATGIPLTSSGLFASGGEFNAGVAAYSNLLNIISASTPGASDVPPVIYSPTYDLVTPVTSVEADTVPDIQRRRADALVGVRTARPFPPA